MPEKKSAPITCSTGSPKGIADAGDINARERVKSRENIKNSGFTLIELLITLALSSMILTAVTSTFILQARFFEKQANIVDIHENTRAGMQMMTSELMMAGYDPTGLADATLTSAGENAVAFTADLNGDADVSDSREKVAYALDEKDSQITRNRQPVAENISALTFVYYGFNGQPLSQPINPGDVKRIGIRVEAGYAGISRSMEAQVALRNVFRE